LDVWCQSPIVETEVQGLGSAPSRRDVPMIDVCATADPAGSKVSLAVVNRSLTQSVDLAIHGVHFDPAVEAQLLSGDDPHCVNDFSCPDRIGPESVAIGSLLTGQSLRIPPLSVFVLTGAAN
jgi:alpha-L-arabinofuranosidase